MRRGDDRLSELDFKRKRRDFPHYHTRPADRARRPCRPRAALEARGLPVRGLLIARLVMMLHKRISSLNYYDVTVMRGCSL